MSLLTDWINRLFNSGWERPGMGPLTEFEDRLQALVLEGKIPGLAITVLREGEILFEKGFGYADIDLKTPVDPQRTFFRIASASKPIAAMALATLVAERKIDLDRSFYDYVSYFPRKEHDFTLRQLAAHTAGIRGYKGKEYALNKPYSIQEGIKIFQDDPLVFPPGKGYLYNSFGWVLISLAVQEVTGIPFDACVRQRVLDPLGMNNTRMEVPGDPPEGMARFYTKRGLILKQAIPVDNRYKIAGGGYLSTSADLAKLGTACLEHSLVPQGVMKEFLTAQHINGASTYYGLGWQVSADQGGRHFVGHVGNGVGGYSNFFVYPEEQVVVSLLINCTDPKVQGDIDTGLGLLLGHARSV